GIAHQHPDAPHPVGLLRARRERPRSRRAAECGQQFPPSDGDCHTPLPREGAFAKIPRHERAVLTARPSARVGGGTPGTGLGSPPTLRLAFKSCLLCPRKRTSLACLGMSALCQKRTHAVQQIYSITSSARSSNVSGIVRPSAFAVVRLTTRSNLVGCSTGMSAGFVPRRILST